MDALQNTNNRTLEEFAKELAYRIERGLTEDYGIDAAAEIQPVMKTNGQKMGITAHFGDSRVAPTVYADEAYKQYLNGDVTIPDIASKMCEKLNEAREMSPEIPVLTPEEAKKHITLNLVNTELNQEMLAKTPHF